MWRLQVQKVSMMTYEHVLGHTCTWWIRMGMARWLYWYMGLGSYENFNHMHGCNGPGHAWVRVSVLTTLEGIFCDAQLQSPPRI